jgi:hypothetical protein
MGGGGPDPVEGDASTATADGKGRRGWGSTGWGEGGGGPEGRWSHGWGETTRVGEAAT